MATFRVNVKSSAGVWGVEGSELGVSRICLPHEYATASRGTAPEPVALCAHELGQYFAGARTSFTTTLAPVVATDFQRSVWRALQAIPYGTVRTYAELAQCAGHPRAARAVGNANHANPWPIVVPCHRVVARQGLGGYGGGAMVKRFLLEREGFVYD